MKGILFKPDMIQAIVEGRKTQTRRLAGLNDVNMVGLDGAGQPTSPDQYEFIGIHNGIGDFVRKAIETPYLNIGVVYHCKPLYQVGETVYIKETWAIARWDPYEVVDIMFRDGGYKLDIPWDKWCDDNQHKTNWESRRSPRFLRERFARYFLTITDVRAERLQEITDEDAISEGIDSDFQEYPRLAFLELWNSINKDYQWESNPWVWVYELIAQKSHNEK